MFSPSPKTELSPSLTLDLISAKINALEASKINNSNSQTDMIELTPSTDGKLGLSVLNADTLARGMREYFDLETSRRFITSPFELQQAIGEFDSKEWKTIAPPKFVGTVRGDYVDTVYLYEIPTNSVAISSINLLATASDPNSLLNNIESTMRDLKEANSHLPTVVFDQWHDHWAYDTNGQLILINPFNSIS